MINLALLRPHGMAGSDAARQEPFWLAVLPERWRVDAAPAARPGNANAAHGVLQRTGRSARPPPLGRKNLPEPPRRSLLRGVQRGQRDAIRLLRQRLDIQHTGLAGRGSARFGGRRHSPSEPNATRVTGNADNYLHEAALASEAASGVAYDPDGGGKRLGSLGVHEHWNNATERKYSGTLAGGRNRTRRRPSKRRQIGGDGPFLFFSSRNDASPACRRARRAVRWSANAGEPVRRSKGSRLPAPAPADWPVRAPTAFCPLLSARFPGARRVCPLVSAGAGAGRRRCTGAVARSTAAG